MRRLIASLVFAALTTAAHAESAPDRRCAAWAWFDDKGVAITAYGGDIGTQYNPTAISMIALNCIRTFRQTKTQNDWRIVLDQINWLRKNIVMLSKDAGVYEHHFTWGELKPGWRSGSAQHNAFDVMIQYYKESKDASILPVIKVLKNGMMLPVAKGGTIAKTPEGGIWIEEFPTTPPSLALGSFMGSIDALHDFTLQFPTDKQAQQDLKATMASLKASLKYYDVGRWLRSDRHGPPAGPPADGYGNIIPQMLLYLVKFDKDPRLLETSLRWRSFFEDVHLKAAGNVSKQSDGLYHPDIVANKSAFAEISKDVVEVASVSPKFYPDYGPDKLFDDNIDSYFSADVGPAEINLHLKQSQSFNTLRISLYSVDLYPLDTKIEVKAGDEDFKDLPYEVEADRRFIYFRFAGEVKADEVRVSATRFSQQNRLIISGLAFGNMKWDDRSEPAYCSHTTPPVEKKVASFQIKIDAPAASAGQIFVIHRHAASVEAIDAAPWEWDYLDPLNPRQTPSLAGAAQPVHQYRVLCTADAGKRGWKSMTVQTKEGASVYRE